MLDNHGPERVVLQSHSLTVSRSHGLAWRLHMWVAGEGTGGGSKELWKRLSRVPQMHLFGGETTGRESIFFFLS